MFFILHSLYWGCIESGGRGREGEGEAEGRKEI